MNNFDMDCSDHSSENDRPERSDRDTSMLSLSKPTKAEDTRLPITSTPLMKTILRERITSPNLSLVIERPHEEEGVVPTPQGHRYERRLVDRVSLRRLPLQEEEEVVEPTPQGLRYERRLVDQFCLRRLPTTVHEAIIPPKEEITPETENKYRNFLKSPVASRKRYTQRKNLRL